MKGVWTADQIRSAEDQLITEIGPAAIMERAAYPLAVHSASLLPRRYGARVVLLIGAGKNGGDALLAGAHLLRRGARVHAVLLVPDRVHEQGRREFLAAGGRFVAAAEGAAVLARADLVLDGITGIGGRGALRPEAAALVAAVGRIPVVAVDVPSGVDTDTGDVPGSAVQARLTVSFGGLKPGLVVGAGRTHSGEVRLVDIGLGPYLGDPVARLLEDADVAALLPVPRPGDDKYGQGVVGVVAGSATYPGAAVMCVGAALHGKSGMVRYAGSAAELVRSRWPEAVVTEQRPADAGRVQAWVIGPGLGTDDHAKSLVREVLASNATVLIDADGLAVLAEEPELVRDRDAATVLTPHDREFARIWGDPGDDRMGAAVRAAAGIGATVLLKGQATIVAGPDGVVFVNPTGSGWLATAGTGDVLSGLTGALLSAGGDPTTMAAVAAYLHGLAGARAGGDTIASGVGNGAPATAMDVLRAIPDSIRSVRQGVGHVRT